jgi:hypothetical protein
MLNCLLHQCPGDTAPSPPWDHGQSVDRSSPSVPACDHRSHDLPVDFGNQKRSGTSFYKVFKGLRGIGRQETQSGLPPNVQHLATLFGTAGPDVNLSSQPHLSHVLQPGGYATLEDWKNLATGALPP